MFWKVATVSSGLASVVTIISSSPVSARPSPRVRLPSSTPPAAALTWKFSAPPLIFGSHSIAAPLPAPGYQLPIAVDDPTDAANLAVRMENDAATAWRAVLEQSTDSGQRAFAVSALTQSAVLAARWKQVLEVWPVTQAFPGGNE